MKRRATRQVRAGNLLIGGDAPISVQTMTKCPIEDVQGTVDQIRHLEKLGADLVRVALRTEESVESLRKVISSVSVPLCADIHFNHRIAIAAIDAGVKKVRINPGNIGSAQRVREVVRAALDHDVPIRIGVNGGSVDRKKYSEVTPRSLVDSAMEHVRLLEDNNFTQIAVSLKSSDLNQTVEANRIFSALRDYPLHVGLTEAGYGLTCVVQSSIAIGSLLMEGIGDTIRVSMTGDSADEIIAGKKILEAVGERIPAIRIISCPGCGRTDPSLNLPDLAREAEKELTMRFENALRTMGHSITVAVMGCEVNGPGEASHADAGLAGGQGGVFLLFIRGEIIRKVHRDEAVSALAGELQALLDMQ